MHREHMHLDAEQSDGQLASLSFLQEEAQSCKHETCQHTHP